MTRLLALSHFCHIVTDWCVPAILGSVWRTDRAGDKLAIAATRVLQESVQRVGINGIPMIMASSEASVAW